MNDNLIHQCLECGALQDHKGFYHKIEGIKNNIIYAPVKVRAKPRDYDEPPQTFEVDVSHGLCHLCGNNVKERIEKRKEKNGV